jgi:hypothetical protein
MEHGSRVAVGVAESAYSASGENIGGLAQHLGEGFVEEPPVETDEHHPYLSIFHDLTRQGTAPLKTDNLGCRFCVPLATHFSILPGSLTADVNCRDSQETQSAWMESVTVQGAGSRANDEMAGGIYGSATCRMFIS